MLPPILEVYVVWHPHDDEGAPIADLLLGHFRGTAFSGLIGGAVEVYARSASGTVDPGDAPRSLPCTAPLPYGLPSPALTAVVLVAGAELAAAVEQGGPWRTYVETLVAARDVSPEAVGIFSVRTDDHVFDGTALGDLVGGVLGIAEGAFGTDEFEDDLCRDLAQGIGQMGTRGQDRVTVFISHTKRRSVFEQPPVESLVKLVREVVANTRLGEFFDAHDLQVNEDWGPALDAAAATGALLAVRTDLYSSRPWCQREVLTAKRNGMPVVVLDALTSGEERGSFVMDHVPRTPGRQEGDDWRRRDIVRSLGQLVDECLKRVLWRMQRKLAEDHGLPVDIDWWAPHAPEPSTFVAWLTETTLDEKRREPLIVLHPDPPLGPDERDVLLQIAHVAGLNDNVDFLTPRGLAVRGG